MKPHERIIVALDVATPNEAIGLVRELRDHVGCFKIGLQFITAMLKSIIVPVTWEATSNLTDIRILFAELQDNIFWDGKFNDIPNTVAGAVVEVNNIRVKMFNVHVSSGAKAIAEASKVKGDSLLLGVTVLTSLCDDDCHGIFGDSSVTKVLQFAKMVMDNGGDGIVCSALELKNIRWHQGRYKIFEKLPLAVIPGIRPEWASVGDQKRVMTPGEAVKAGADYLVIGRPIIKPPAKIGGPVEAAKLIAAEIEKALKEV